MTLYEIAAVFADGDQHALGTLYEDPEEAKTLARELSSPKRQHERDLLGIERYRIRPRKVKCSRVGDRCAQCQTELAPMEKELCAQCRSTREKKL